MPETIFNRRRTDRFPGDRWPSDPNSQDLLRRLEQQTRIFDTALSAITDFAYIFDRDGRFLYVNQALLSLWGLPLEDAVGKNFFDLKYPDALAERLQRQIREVIETRQVLKDETPYTSLTGAGGYYEYIFSPVINSAGTVEFVAGSTRDITERHRAEESAERFRFVAESMPQKIFTAKPNGDVDYMNRQWTDYSGLSFEQMKDWGWTQLIHPDEAEANLGLWKHCLETGESLEFEQRFRRADGVYRWHLGRTLPMRDAGGRITMWIGTNTDVDDQKRAAEDLRESQLRLAELNKRLEQEVVARTEALRKKEAELHQAMKLEAVGRLAGGVAHDFNNLITGILGISEELRVRFSGDQEARQDIEQIMEASNRAFAVTKQLLAFARRQVLQPEVLDMNAVIVDTHKFLQRLIGEDIKISLSLGEINRVKIDRGHLEQMIMNLAVNARDAMLDGGTLTLRTANYQVSEEGLNVPPGHYVRLDVADTGTGMSQETLSHIFEPFFTTKEKDKGTGLGLAMVYGIVKQNNGGLEVETQPGMGTTFSLIFPAVLQDAPANDKTRQPASALEGKETILVIEDEDIVRRVIVKKLRQKGYRVLEASDGKNALALLDSGPQPVDLVVTDVVMPEMNGREVAEQIRRKIPGVAVLYMSGYPEAVIAHRGVLEQGIAFIDKTALGGDGLVSKIRTLLDKRKFELFGRND